ncbi:MAG TPA: hypothetical protein VFO01_03570 [Trebonia sp.]|nr:hypothetical protein [Trebonia sp.]
MTFHKQAVDGDLLWPEPWLSLNPSFESGGSVPELCGEGLLHPACAEVFTRDTGEPLVLHRHQREAIEAARADAGYVLTTGTGSGKSLAYIVPIVDHVLRGIRAGRCLPAQSRRAGRPETDQGATRVPRLRSERVALRAAQLR